MRTFTSLLMKSTLAGLCIKLLFLATILTAGVMTLPSMSFEGLPMMTSFYGEELSIRKAEDECSVIEEKTGVVRQRNSVRMDIVKDVAAGKLSKEAATEHFLVMNQSDPIILQMLHLAYPNETDLECSRRQLEQYLKILNEESYQNQIGRVGN